MKQITDSEMPAAFKKILADGELLQKMEEHAGTGMWYAGLGNENVAWSPGMSRIYGYAPESPEPSMEVFFKHVHAEDLAIVEKAFAEVKTHATSKNLDFRILDKSGVLKYIDAVFFRETDGGNVIMIKGLARDITEIKICSLTLKDSQAYYRAAIESLTSVFFVTNGRSEILEANEVACKMFGYTGKELKQLCRHQILDEADPQFVTALQHLYKTGHMRGEVAGRKKNGDSILLEFTSTKFLDGSEEDRLIFSMIDITTRKIQEETLLKSHERFEQVSKASFDVIWDWDVKLQQLYFGERFKQLFGHEVENNTGDFSTWYMHIHPEDKERVIFSRLNKIVHLADAAWKEEYRYIRADGSVAYISDRGIVLRNSSGTYRMIGVMQDVTELKENELAISNLNKSLHKRAEELAISNGELERFAYVASHDLQEPLRMVTSFLQLLQKKYDNELDDTAQKYIGYAVDGADRMKALIMDLLDFSRISSDKNIHININLNDLLGKTLQVLKPVIEESEALVVVSILPEIWGNRFQLMRLFQNLISNAIKYRSALKPMIEIGCVETEGEWQFFVKDNGIGVEAKYFEKIFIIFQRLHSRTDYSGTGIGLAICKKIADLHSGRIWIESSLKTGSIFYVSIPKVKSSGRIVPHFVS